MRRSASLLGFRYEGSLAFPTVTLREPIRSQAPDWRATAHVNAPAVFGRHQPFVLEQAHRVTNSHPGDASLLGNSVDGEAGEATTGSEQLASGGDDARPGLFGADPPLAKSVRAWAHGLVLFPIVDQSARLPFY